jgi:hypothetical protein
MAQRIPGRNRQAAWDGASAMNRHLDWLEHSTGREATRDVVDASLVRLSHQLARLERGAPGPQLLRVASGLRDCGVLLGNAALARCASSLLEGLEARPQGSRPRLDRLASEARRTASWLHMWRALNSPARSWNAPLAGAAFCAAPGRA